MFNTMTLGDIALESHLCAWSLGEWLFQFMMTDYDKDDGGDFNVVGRTLLAAAKATFPHLACSSEAATVAAFFDLGEQLPPDMLSNHFDKGTRLKWIANVARWSTPANRIAMLEENFGKVLRHHSELAKWTGAAPDAYSHFCTLLRLLMSGAKPTFDVVAQLASELLKHKDYWKERRRHERTSSSSRRCSGHTLRPTAQAPPRTEEWQGRTRLLGATMPAHSPSCSPTSTIGARAVTTKTVRRQSLTS